MTQKMLRGISHRYHHFGFNQIFCSNDQAKQHSLLNTQKIHYKTGLYFTLLYDFASLEPALGISL